MTAYNREQYIGAAIESVLSSKYSNWELIIVDDKSKDSTFEVSSRYAKQDNRIAVYINENNLGDYFNRNKAAGYAKGKYLKYLDADDLIYPYTLNIMVDAMEKFPQAALGIEQFFYEEINQPFPILMKPEWVVPTQFLKYGVLNVGPSGAIIKASVFHQLNGFSGKRFVGDTELWLKIAVKYPIVFLQPTLVFWRRHDGQEIDHERKDLSSQLLRYQMNRDIIISLESPFLKEERTTAFKKLNRRFITNLVKMPFSGYDLRKMIELYKNSGITMKETWNAIFH